MKILVPGLIVFSLWCVLSVRWYVCGIYEMCGGQDASMELAEEKPIKTPEKTPPASTSPAVAFDWSSSETIVGDNFEAFRDSIVRVFDQSPESIVEITGYFDPQEQNTSDSKNLGLARAENLKALLLSSGIKRSIRTRSEERKLQLAPEQSLNHVYAIDLVPQEEATNGFLITEAQDKLLIHYLGGQASPNSNHQVQQALKSIANEAIKNKRRLLVVGHTDNRGEAMDNMKLGLVRATDVKQLLISYGMNEKDVLAESEGEAVPLVSNSTPRGRQQNRRVEIILI